MQRKNLRRRTARAGRWLAIGLAPLAGLLALSACSTARNPVKDYDPALVRFFMEADRNNEYASIAVLPVSKVRIPINGRAIISEYDIVGAEVGELEYGKALVLKLTPLAARAFYRESTLNQGKRVVVSINGQPMGVRRLDRPVANEQVVFYLETKDENLAEIARNIKGTSFDIQKKLKS